MEILRVGPAHTFYGNPTTAAGAGMTYLGKTRGQTRVAIDVGIAMGRADQKGRTPLADAVYQNGVTAVATIPMVDEDKDTLAAMMPYATKTTAGGLTAVGFGSGFSRIAVADVGTLCILPVDETAEGTNGIESEKAIWLPRAIVTAPGDFLFDLPEGEDVFNPREVTLMALYYEEDHGATAIPADSRVAFLGAPTALGLTWFLPAVG